MTTIATTAATDARRSQTPRACLDLRDPVDLHEFALVAGKALAGIGAFT